MSINDKYNELVSQISKRKAGDTIRAKDFQLDTHEFRTFIEEIEKDGLIKAGDWYVERGAYGFNGLTLQGMSFIESNDKKQYSKIEKTEVNYNNHITVGGDNAGNIIVGSGNYVNYEFERKFSDLINAVNSSTLQDKEMILEKLNTRKNDKVSLQQYAGELLSRGAEVGSIVSTIAALLSL